MIDWKAKLASRKLWALVAGLVTALGIVFGMSNNGLAQLLAIVGAFGSIMTYILGESTVDAARVSTPQLLGTELKAFEYKTGTTEPVPPEAREL